MLDGRQSPDLKGFLVSTPFFGGLSDARLDILVSMLSNAGLTPARPSCLKEEPGRSMYVVHAGELGVSKAALQAVSFAWRGWGRVIFLVK